MRIFPWNYKSIYLFSFLSPNNPPPRATPKTPLGDENNAGFALVDAVNNEKHINNDVDRIDAIMVTDTEKVQDSLKPKM